MTGGWLERYVDYKVRDFASRKNLNIQSLCNARITLPNGTEAELDCFYLLEGQPLWLECKTGEYQAHIYKYSEMRQALDVASLMAFLVVAKMEDALAKELTALYRLTVVNEQNFIEHVEVVLEELAQAVKTAPEARESLSLRLAA